MRIATFNLESLDLPVEPRLDVLQPALERLRADVLCLQEVNAQHVHGEAGRRLLALDRLLEGTSYENHHRAWTTARDGKFPADVHNLVTLSRFPILASEQIWHTRLPAAVLHLATAVQDELTRVTFDRPILRTDVDLGGETLSVLNVHLRAPLAAAIPGGKLAPFVWRSVAAWAEGFYVSGIKRMGQAVELRLTVETMLDEDPHRLIAIAGDFNAEDRETPLKIVIGAPEDTGNGELAARALVLLDRGLDSGRRFSVVHHGRRQMLDHILVSQGLYARFAALEVHNETLGDEAVGYAKGVAGGGSYHAAVTASFNEAIRWDT